MIAPAPVTLTASERGAGATFQRTVAPTRRRRFSYVLQKVDQLRVAMLRYWSFDAIAPSGRSSCGLGNDGNTRQRKIIVWCVMQITGMRRAL